MRVVFFGTPEPAAVALDALIDSTHDVAAVITQPDRPRGRSGAPQPPPAKERALAAGIPVLQPESPKQDGFAEELSAYSPDAGAIVAYGHILPQAVLATPRKGTVNVHFSLLPRYRGAAPVQRAIIAGERETGVTTFLLEPTLDTGPILLQARERIAADDTAGTLMDRLAVVGARTLVETLDGLEGGTLSSQTQDPSLATPAPKLTPEEGIVDWTRPSSDIANLIRGFNPSPGASTRFRGKRLKVWRAAVAIDAVPAGAPGTLQSPGKERIVVVCGVGAVELLELQIEGGKRLDAAAFARGQRLSAGEILERG